MKTILLMRHGKTVAKPGAFCGSTDVELSDVGRQQSITCMELILENKAELVITTGMKRTDYVGILARSKHVKHIVNRDFREINFGEWEGLAWPEIEQRYTELAERWIRRPGAMTFPGGESIQEFDERIERAWQRTLKRPEGVIAIVGHSAALAGVISLITDHTDPPYLRHGEVLRFGVPA
jgi:alpha-ribazole phosphatase